MVPVNAPLKLEHVLHAFVPHEGGSSFTPHTCRAAHEHFLSFEQVFVVVHPIGKLRTAFDNDDVSGDFVDEIYT